MNYFRFEIKTKGGLVLKTHFSGKEENGLIWCKRFIREFRKDFPGAELKIVIFEREKTKKIWEDRHKPYVYKRTLSTKVKNHEMKKGDGNQHEVEDV